MYTLQILILICALQYMKCEDEMESKVITIPKKFETPLHKSIKIINTRKFNKLRRIENPKNKYKKNNKHTYTAFPPISEKVGIEAADNLYFQGLHVADRKPRVKKVLPEYGLNVFRNKRSADINQTKKSNRTLKRKRKIKNEKNVGNTHKHKIKNVHRENADKPIRLSKLKSKNIKGEVTTYIYRKQKRKSTKAGRPRHGKMRPSVSLKYTEKDRNKTVSHKNKKSRVRTNKRNKSKKLIKRHEERKVQSRRLIAGRDAMIREYPYVVSIQKGDEHWCAGALLNQRVVITTANCIWKAHRVSRMRVRAGTRHMDRGGQVAKILEVIKHPSWNIRGSPDNDLGLLLLDRNIKFSDSVHGVDLPNHAMLPAFEDVWVTSWGSNRRDGVYDKIASTLQVYHAMLLDHDKCNNVTLRFGIPVSHNFICVTQTGRRAPCTRDTGAPAVSDGILWGVASWGIRKLCGTERFPAMFTYLASKSNLDFITNGTHELMSDKRFYPYADRFDFIRPNIPKSAAL